ncbi:MAG: site-2 protease family protein [Candidatus Levybacteria bacterium]|nr:site-2 protease family protein [Candidatus Levybacteria bacterium]
MSFLFDPFVAILITLAILVFSAILHEIAHGYVADRFGDPTARLMGRLTLNPIPHLDPFMSIILPLLLAFTGSPIILGGAKPVPVDPFNLKDGRKDIALVSLAGPMTNLILAVIASLFAHVLFPGMSLGSIERLSVPGFLLSTIIRMNILLTILNLLPIPPLDGSKIFSLILPDREARTYLSLGNLGPMLLLFLFFFPLGPFSLVNIITELSLFTLKLLGF